MTMNELKTLSTIEILYEGPMPAVIPMSTNMEETREKILDLLRHASQISEARAAFIDIEDVHGDTHLINLLRVLHIAITDPTRETEDYSPPGG